MLGEKSHRSLQRGTSGWPFMKWGILLSEHVRPGSVASITIASRSQALGYIRQNPKGDQYLYTRDQLVEAIQICVAEQ